MTVVPVPPLTKHQPPVAKDDPVTVRAGDIVTVDVLDNDYHPDDSPHVPRRRARHRADRRASPSSEATACASRRPTEPGQYRADYRVLDDVRRDARRRRVIFTVTPVDEESNRDPRPVPVVGARARRRHHPHRPAAAAASTPTATRRSCCGFPTGPALGTIDEQGHDFFDLHGGARRRRHRHLQLPGVRRLRRDRRRPTSTSP